jgi:hypothetical protein
MGWGFLDESSEFQIAPFSNETWGKSRTSAADDPECTNLHIFTWERVQR